MQALTNEQKLEIVERSKEYMVRSGLSQNRLAKTAGINPSYVSHILQGKWDEYPVKDGVTSLGDSVFFKLTKTIGYSVRKQYWQHFDTANFKKIYLAIDTAKKRKIPVAIDGFSGAGKTYSLESYAKKNALETFYVKVADDMSLKDVITELANKVGAPLEGHKYKIRKEIVKKVMNMAQPVIIIDEAENLRDSSWGAIKSIYDDLEGMAAIVIGGLGIFDLITQKAARKRKHFEQVERRFEGTWQFMHEITKEDIIMVADHFGFNDAKVKSWLFSNIKNYGSLQRVISGAVKHQEETNDVITAKKLTALFPQYMKIK